MTILTIQQTYQLDYLDYQPQVACLLIYSTPYVANMRPYIFPVLIGTQQDLTTQPYPTFTDPQSALSYYQVQNCEQVLETTNSTNNTQDFTSYTVVTI